MRYVRYIGLLLWSTQWVVANSYWPGCCYHNYENSIEYEKNLTLKKIQHKEEEVKEKLDAYRQALDNKKKSMRVLLQKIKGVEVLMKENQLERRKVQQLWNGIQTLQTAPTHIKG